MRVISAACVAALACAGQFAAAGGTYSNPVIPADTPDPGATWDPVTRLYWVATTSNNAADHFPVHYSEDLVSWTQAGYIFPGTTAPAWTRSDYWAPEFHILPDGRYMVLYVARTAAGILSVGAALSGNITGPWVDIGQPLVQYMQDGQIDPTYYFDEAAKQAYVIWKEDSNSIGKLTHIYVAALNVTAKPNVTGEATAILVNDPSSWEGPLVEGPWILPYNGMFYLFYSGNGYSTPAYAVGVARSNSIFGPFEKFSGNPIMHSAPSSPTPKFYGPGHCSVLPAQDGTMTMLYHAWNQAGTARNMLLDVLTPTADGWWSIGQPTGIPSTASQPIP